MNRTLVSLLAFASCLPLIGNRVDAQTLTVIEPSSAAVSPRLSDLPAGENPRGNTERAHRPVPSHRGSGGPDLVQQTTVGPTIQSTGGTRFPGLGANGYAPPDTNIAVGPRHIFEAVNSSYAIYDKSGNLVLGPKSLSSLWTPLGGPCATNNGGDTVVQYDRFADRWMLTQLGSVSSPYSQCIAVSTTSDPTGSYYLYSYPYGSTLNDYPKFGVWATATNSAYLATYNLFSGGSAFVGGQLCAYDRAAMLAGASSPVSLCGTINGDGGYLPADVDGPTAPLDGTPGYFLTFETTSTLRMWALSPNFAAKTGTLSQAGDISVASFSMACGGSNCVPQADPGSTLLDSLGDRMMYRLGVTIFADHESMVVNHSVTAGSAVGVRWYELRAPVSTNGGFSLYQQGTFAPADGTYRWMGSAAMDKAGDIGLGYSASSGTIHPAIRYTGRTAADPLGTMEAEASLIEGGGSQTNGLTRWGDYSALRIDPSDDCTFWYANEYIPADGAFNWKTLIGSFKFSACSGGSTGGDFSVAATPSSLVTLRGAAPVTSTVTISSLSGYTGTVGLTVSGCPSNATCSVSPSSVTPTAGGSASATLTVTTTSTTPEGGYSLVVTGSDGTRTHATTVSLAVKVDFTIGPVSPASIVVRRGGSNSVVVPVGQAGQGSTVVTLSASGLPGKTAATFTPSSVATAGSSTLAISANRSAPRGTYTVTITGANPSGFTHTTTLSLTVQ